MDEIVLALKRSLLSLKRARVWYYIAFPAISAAFAMTALAVTLLGFLIARLLEYPPMSWLNAWGAFWAAKILAVLGGWAAIISVCYLLALFLTAVFTLPLMLGFLAGADYPGLARMGRDSVAASVWNSLWGIALFLLGWVVTLPLWLLPGFSVVLPFFWMAWLSRRTFPYDVLMVFATPEEWRVLRKQHAMPLLALGFIMSGLTLLPFAGLLAPSLAALAYGHFCLEALRRLRNGAIVNVLPGSRE
ncbi:MAG: EI24 domain-containing protein [Candidatus Accumulibacter sp.]|jgi:hypothetical protein|nr:EI24 domain-containing protein [Accumulibacter sp.]